MLLTRWFNDADTDVNNSTQCFSICLYVKRHMLFTLLHSCSLRVFNDWQLVTIFLCSIFGIVSSPKMIFNTWYHIIRLPICVHGLLCFFVLFRNSLQHVYNIDTTSGALFILQFTKWYLTHDTISLRSLYVCMDFFVSLYYFGIIYNKLTTLTPLQEHSTLHTLFIPQH